MTDFYFTTNKLASHLDCAASVWDSEEASEGEGSPPGSPPPPPASKRGSITFEETRGKRRRICGDDEASFWEPYKEGEERTKDGLLSSSEAFPEGVGAPAATPLPNTTSSLTTSTSNFSSCTFFNVASALSACVLQICTSANRGVVRIKKEDRCRLQFLNETIGLIVAYQSNQREQIKDLATFQEFFGIITARMVDVLKMLRRIERMESTITDNFDIFELKLRGYLEEMKAVFPLEGAPPPPLSLIADTSSRYVWAKCFGKNTAFVTLERFLAMLETEGIFERGSELFSHAILYLRYFVSFPSGDLISTFKWNQLTRLFGPFDNFATNFQRTVTGKGFLGLINRIQAYEILTMTYRPCSLLIRASRTEPQFLAFSYKDKDGKIAHRLNKDRHGQLVPVEEFIRSKFPGYELVDKRLDLEKILGSENFPDPLSHYASEIGGYFH